MDENEEMLEDVDEINEETSEANEQDDAEFSETGEEETGLAEPSQTESGNAKVEAEKKAKTEQDSFQAEKRKQREEKERAIRKRIEEEAYKKGIVEAVGGVNPYTGEEMKDSADIEEFLTMREIERSGKDPVSDYRQSVKDKERAKAKEGEEREKRVSELKNFEKAFPEVKLNTLFSDPRFCKFAGKRIDNESLTDVYSDYLSFTAEVDGAAQKNADMRAKQKAARAKASPGSLTGNGGDLPRKTYANMSDDEFEKAIAKAKTGALKKS